MIKKVLIFVMTVLLLSCSTGNNDLNDDDLNDEGYFEEDVPGVCQNKGIKLVSQVGGNPDNFHYADGKIYALCNYGEAGGLCVYDISEENNILNSGDFFTEENVKDIVVDGKIAYLTSYDGLMVFDISDGSGIELLHHVNPSGYQHYDKLLKKGSFLFIASENYLSVHKLSDIDTPPELVWQSSVSDIKWMEINGNYLYLTSYHDYPSPSGGYFAVFDITDPDKPVKTGDWDVKDSIESFEIKGNYAYLPRSSNGIIILDISNHDDIKSVGSFAAEDCWYSEIDIYNETIFAKCSSNNLQLIDISTPLDPALIQTWELDVDYINNFSVDYPYLFVSDTGYSKMYDISGLASPVKIWDFFTIAFNSEITVSDKNAFLWNNTKLTVVSTEHKDHPAITAFSNDDKNINGALADNNNLFLAYEDKDLEIVDVSSNEIKKIATVSETKNIKRMEIYEKRIFAANSSKGLQIIDISNPEKAEVIKTFKNYKEISDLKVSDQYVVISTQSKEIIVLSNKDGDDFKLLFSIKDNPNYNVAIYKNYIFAGQQLYEIDDSELIDKGLVDIPYSNYNSLIVSGDYLLTSNSSYESLGVYNISSPEKPVAAGFIYNYHGNFAVNGDYVFTTSGGLNIYNLKNAVSPQNRKLINEPGAQSTVRKNDSLFVITDYKDKNKLTIADFKNEEYAPVSEIDLNTYFYPKKMVVKDDTLFLPDKENIIVVDISDTANPKEISRIDAEAPSEVKGLIVKDKVLYYLSYSLMIFDISDLSAPVLFSELDGESSFIALAVRNNTAYVATYDKTILAIDIKTPAKPTIISETPIAGRVTDFLIKDDYLFAASGYNGIDIFDIKDRSNIKRLKKYVSGDKILQIIEVDDYIAVLNKSGRIQLIDFKNIDNPDVFLEFSNYSSSGTSDIFYDGKNILVSSYNGISVINPFMCEEFISH